MANLPPTSKWSWVLDTLSSPNFWKMAAAFGTSMGIALSPDQVAAITSAGLAVMGVVNAFQHYNRNNP